MRKLIWRFKFTLRICKRFRDYMFWKWWWVSGAAIENDPAWMDWYPENAADEELSYWND